MTALLDISNLELGYKSAENSIFKDVSIKLSRGELIIVKGKNGSGKSTLLDFIFDYSKSKVGKYTYLSDRIAIGSDISIVYQDPNSQILTFKVFEEIATKLSYKKLSREKRIEIVNEIIYNFNMQKISKKDPRNISSGERQKTVILSNLVDKTDLILMDEPFTFLDEANIEDFKHLIETLIEEKMAILITTHYSVLDNMATDVITLDPENIALEKTSNNFKLVASKNTEYYKLDIKIGYQNEISHLNIDLPKKGVVLINGNNGSGKTCLLMTLGGLVPPISGSIKFSEIAFYLPPKVTYIFSKPTVEEELGDLNPPPLLKNLMKRSPFKLSIGEQKYLALYIIINKFDICLLDEPFQSLDREFSEAILTLLRNSKEDKLIILSSNKKLPFVEVLEEGEQKNIVRL